MSVRVTVTVPAARLGLERALTADAGHRVEFERAVPVGSRAVPYLWVTSDEAETAVELVADSAAVERAAVVARTEDARLLRVEWRREHRLFRTVLDARASCLEAVGERGAWHLTLRFRSHDSLASWYRDSLDDDLGVTVETVRESARAPAEDAAPTLTDPQREILRAALDRGFFSVPREITLQELADGLDISDTAASQRLRRGLAHLLAERLAAPVASDAGGA